MHLIDLAHVLAATEDRPARMARVLYLTEVDGGLEPAGFADAVGDVASVLDRLDTEGADGLAVQVRVPTGVGDGAVAPAAVVATRAGGFALSVAGPHALALDRAPAAGDPEPVAACWRLVVHALAALQQTGAIPEPPDDPHPAAYLAAAWVTGRLDEASDPADLADLDLPDEAGLVEELGLPAGARGWDAVHAAVAARRPRDASRLGRNGVAWRAHDLLAEPGAALAALAGTGHVAVADRLFAALTERGWARPA